MFFKKLSLSFYMRPSVSYGPLESDLFRIGVYFKEIWCEFLGIYDLFAAIKLQLKTLQSSYEDFSIFEGHNGMKCFLQEHSFYIFVIHVSFIFTLSKKCMTVRIFQKGFHSIKRHKCKFNKNGKRLYVALFQAYCLYMKIP